MIKIGFWGALSVILGLLCVIFFSFEDNTYYNSDFNMTEPLKIADNEVKSPVSGEVVPMKSLWENQTVVVTFFRRFGCAFCRLAAKQLSGIKPQLDANNVRLVGIGVESLGVEEFISGGFFDGDLYIDEGKKCYQDMNYKRYGVLSLIPALFVKTSRDAIGKANAEKLGGDLKGDYYQVGGTLVVSKGGEKVLLNHKQESLADHINPAEVLKSLGIEVESKSESESKPASESIPECKSNVECEIPNN